jgi:hypothetical protein
MTYAFRLLRRHASDPHALLCTLFFAGSVVSMLVAAGYVSNVRKSREREGTGQFNGPRFPGDPSWSGSRPAGLSTAYPGPGGTYPRPLGLGARPPWAPHHEPTEAERVPTVVDPE